MCFYTDGLVGGLALSKVSLSGRKKNLVLPCTFHLKVEMPPPISHDSRQLKSTSKGGRGTSLFSWLLCVCFCESRFGSHKRRPSIENNQGAGYQSNLFCFFVSFKRDSSKKSEARCILRDSPCESLYSAWYLSLEEAIGCVREQGLPI